MTEKTEIKSMTLEELERFLKNGERSGFGPGRLISGSMRSWRIHLMI